jgi:hypothetical protein
VGCAAAGQYTLLDGLTVGQQTDAVAGEKSQLCESDSSGAGVVQLGVWLRRCFVRG